nr:uncharacterized protein LOC128692631 [Cherax quadricarinatus]
MKLFLLLCVSVVAGNPLRARSSSPSVFDYYDFVEIPRTQTAAAPRADGPLSPRRPGPHRRPGLPIRAGPPRRRPQPIRQGAPDYQLASAEVHPPQFRQQPQFRPKFRPQYQKEVPVIFREEPVFEKPVFSKPQYQQEPIMYVEEVVTGRPFEVMERPQRHQDDQMHRQQGERPPLDHDYPLFRPPPPKFLQKERHPQSGHLQQNDDIYEDFRQYEEQSQQEERPKFEQERLQYDERQQFEDSPQYEERPQFEEYPKHEQDLPVYEDVPEYEVDRRPQHQQEAPPVYAEPIKKDIRKPAISNYVPKTKVKEEQEPGLEKRQVIHGGHLDPAGEQFVVDAAEAESATGDGRLSFQIHGQQGPHSYRFGYDTGKGYNRQFRYEERDGVGQVHGRYGFYDKDGKLQVVNYSAHPDHGFSADVPH